MKPLKKLILVDDDKDVLTIARYCLQELKDTEVKYLSSGQEAIKEALTFLPDLMLIDVMMPQMDGIATLKALHLIPTLSQTPIVFFTAKVQQEELNEYFHMGVIDVLVKPFDPLTLASHILSIWEKYTS